MTMTVESSAYTRLNISLAYTNNPIPLYYY